MRIRIRNIARYRTEAMETLPAADQKNRRTVGVGVQESLQSFESFHIFCNDVIRQKFRSKYEYIAVVLRILNFFPDPLSKFFPFRIRIK